MKRTNISLKQQRLASVLSRKDVWTGSRSATPVTDTQASGWDALDRLLLGKGWPRSELVEICHAGTASGVAASSLASWQLLLPCLQALQQQPGYFFLLNPPMLPYLPGLRQQGIDCSRLLVVSVDRVDAWLASWIDILDSGSCTALLAWQPGSRLRYAQLRKMQLAASRNSSFTWLLRDRASLKANTPAALRLQVQPQHAALQVRIEKQRGTYRLGRADLPWPGYLQADRLQRLQNSTPAGESAAGGLLQFPGRRP